MLAADIAKSLSQMGFPRTSWVSEGQVSVEIDGIERGEDPQPFYILSLEQRDNNTNAGDYKSNGHLQ